MSAGMITRWCHSVTTEIPARKKGLITRPEELRTPAWEPGGP